MSKHFCGHCGVEFELCECSTPECVSLVTEDLKEHRILECAYCASEVPLSEESEIPEVNDDERWDQVAEHHREDCDWIKTRAHRRD